MSKTKRFRMPKLPDPVNEQRVDHLLQVVASFDAAGRSVPGHVLRELCRLRPHWGKRAIPAAATAARDVLKRAGGALLALLLALPHLSGQLPPPDVAMCSPVGTTMQQQTGAAHGSTRIGAWAFTEETGASPTFAFANAILTGGRLWLVAHGLDAAHPNPLTFLPHGVGAYWFLFAPHTVPSAVQMPGAAAGHDQVFVDIAAMSTSSPWISFNLIDCSPFVDLACGQLVVPVTGLEQHWLYIDVPNDPALSGAVFSTQAVSLVDVFSCSRELRLDVR
jgi:hypothetical protein